MIPEAHWRAPVSNMHPTAQDCPEGKESWSQAPRLLSHRKGQGHPKPRPHFPYNQHFLLCPGSGASPCSGCPHPPGDPQQPDLHEDLATEELPMGIWAPCLIQLEEERGEQEAGVGRAR